MKHVIFGLFTDSKNAGEAVSELKGKGYAESISLVAKDEETGEVTTHQVEQDATEGAAAGAAVGGVMGALTGIIAGLTAVAVPGVGTVLVAGPLLTAWGITGAAAGALTGGIVGALVDLGVPEETAEMYKDRILRGEVLVAVSADEHEDETEIQAIMAEHGAADSALVHVDQ